MGAVRVALGENEAPPHRFRECVDLAVKGLRGDGFNVEVVHAYPESATPQGADAVIWQEQARDIPHHLDGLPTALVAFTLPGASLKVSTETLLAYSYPRAELLVLDEGDNEGSAARLAAWLRLVAGGVTWQERQMLEVIAGAILRALDERRVRSDADSLAQFRAASETIEVQLRAPSASRRVVKWALGQLAQFPLGLLSGMAAEYLPELVRRL
jgi:hypothetical protein